MQDGPLKCIKKGECTTVHFCVFCGIKQPTEWKVIEIGDHLVLACDIHGSHIQSRILYGA